MRIHHGKDGTQAQVVGISMKKSQAAHRPEEDAHPPLWVHDCCFAIHWVDRGANQYIATPDEARKHYVYLFGEEPPAPFVFWHDLWRTPARMNKVFYAQQAPDRSHPETVMQQERLL